MKKALTLFWILIVLGGGFLLYDNFVTKPAEEEDFSKPTFNIPSTSTTPLQDEIAKETSENKTYSSIIKEGDQYHNNGYMEEALTAYKRALTANPNSKEALYKIGLTYLEDNKPAEAKLYFEQLKELHDNIQIDVLIGRTILNERKIEEAKIHFDKLATENPTDEEVLYYKAIILLLYQNHEEALSELEALAKLQTSTEPPTEPEASIETESPAAPPVEPETNPLKGKTQTLINAYHEFSLHKEGKVQHLEAILAKALIDVGEEEASIPLLYNIIKTQNNYRDAWIMLGYSYLQTGKVEDATDALLQAKTLDPEKPETLFLIGLTHAVREQFDDAIQYFEKAIEVGFEPRSIIDQKLADIYLIKGEYEEALEAYTKIIELDLADSNIYTKAVWICIEKLGKPQRAIGLGERLIKLDPEEAVGYSLRGWAFVADDNYPRAQEDLITALQIDPGLDSAYLHLGWMYEKQDSTQTAKEYYKKAYGLGHGNSIANLAAIRFNNLLRADITSPFSP